MKDIVKKLLLKRSPEIKTTSAFCLFISSTVSLNLLSELTAPR